MEQQQVWYLGIDWGRSRHQACVMTASGEVLGNQGFVHSGAGVIFHFVLGGAFQIISEAVGQFVSHCAVSILRDELESPVFFPRRDFWAQF